MAALDIAGGVRARLIADGVLTNMLATYAGAPAILTDPVPADYRVEERPSVIVAEPFANRADDDFTYARRDAVLNVRLYQKPQGTTLPLLEAAERVRSLLKFWSSDSFSTGKLEASTVTGPVPAPTDDPSIEGRLLTIQLLIKE